MLIVSGIFFEYLSSDKGNKSQNKQMGLHQTKTVKKTINKLKMPPIEWKKIPVDLIRV